MYDVAVVKNDTFSLSGNLTSMQMCEVLFKGEELRDNANKPMKWMHPAYVFVDKGGSYTLFAENASAILYDTYKIESNSVHQKQFSAYANQLALERALLKAEIDEAQVKADLYSRSGDTALYSKYLGLVRINEPKLGTLHYEVFLVLSPKPEYLCDYLFFIDH